MTHPKSLVQTSRHRGVRLTVLVAVHNGPTLDDALLAMDGWLRAVRSQLLNVATDGTAVQRRRPYGFGETSAHDRNTGCTFTLVIEGDNTPITLTEYIQMAEQFRKHLAAAYGQG